MKILKKTFTILALFTLFFITSADRAKAVTAPTAYHCMMFVNSSDGTYKEGDCREFTSSGDDLAVRRTGGLLCAEDESLFDMVETAVGPCTVYNTTEPALYHCTVINDPQGRKNPGDCKEFTSTGRADALDEGRNKQCATTAEEGDLVRVDNGPCLLLGIPGCGGKLKGSIEELQCQAKSLNKANLSTPEDLVGRFINMMLAFIGSISLVLYVVAGFLWMTASGNTEKVTKAKSIMVWTTLGIVVMLASYMLVSFLFGAIAPK